MKYHGICNRVFQKNTLNTIADDTNSAGDKIHPNNYCTQKVSMPQILFKYFTWFGDRDSYVEISQIWLGFF